MKKVNWGVLAVMTALFTVLAGTTVRLYRQLGELGEMNQNLMGRMYDMSDEY